METSIVPLERTDLGEQVYRALRDGIIKQQLKPGAKLTAEETAARFKVSRSPVVAAFQRLATEGLVEIVPQRGTFVTEPSAKDVAETFDIRLMIELYAAQRILESGQVPEFLESIQEPMLRMKQAMTDDDYGDYEAFIAGDHEFHLELVKSAGNQRLITVYENMNVHIQVARAHYVDSVEMARQAYKEHAAIVEAFQAGQLGQLLLALRDHIGNVKGRILQILERQEGKA